VYEAAVTLLSVLFNELSYTSWDRISQKWTALRCTKQAVYPMCCHISSTKSRKKQRITYLWL